MLLCPGVWQKLFWYVSTRSSINAELSAFIPFFLSWVTLMLCKQGCLGRDFSNKQTHTYPRDSGESPHSLAHSDLCGAFWLKPCWSTLHIPTVCINRSVKWQNSLGTNLQSHVWFSFLMRHWIIPCSEMPVSLQHSSVRAVVPPEINNQWDWSGRQSLKQIWGGKKTCTCTAQDETDTSIKLHIENIWYVNPVSGSN